MCSHLDLSCSNKTLHCQCSHLPHRVRLYNHLPLNSSLLFWLLLSAFISCCLPCDLLCHQHCLINSLYKMFHSPLLLLGHFLFPCLCLHLLHLNGVGLAAAHVQLMVAHAQCQNALVDAKAGSIEHKVGGLLVNGLDDKLLVIEGNVPDLTPGKTNLGC